MTLALISRELPDGEKADTPNGISMVSVGRGLPTYCGPRTFHSVLPREKCTGAPVIWVTLHLWILCSTLGTGTQATSALWSTHQLPALFSTIFSHWLHFLSMHSLDFSRLQPAKITVPKRQPFPKICASWLFGEEAEMWILVKSAAQGGFFLVFSDG